MHGILSHPYVQLFFAFLKQPLMFAAKRHTAGEMTREEAFESLQQEIAFKENELSVAENDLKIKVINCIDG